MLCPAWAQVAEYAQLPAPNFYLARSLTHTCSVFLRLLVCAAAKQSALLENLNEETLLQELQTRFDRDLIYTYVGEILVSGV